MKSLKENLLALNHEDFCRTKQGIIVTLLNDIRSAQLAGFSNKAIHQEINAVVPMSFSTFKVTLHRARKLIAENSDRLATTTLNDAHPQANNNNEIENIRITKEADKPVNREMSVAEIRAEAKAKFDSYKRRS